MKFSVPFILSVAAVAAASSEQQIERRSALASTSHATSSGETHIVKRAQKQLQKRLLCGFLGVFCDYSSDVNNCGSAGNVCSSSWANGGGRTCQSGVCGASYCNTGFAFNWSTRQCQSVSSDVKNCGAIGNVCSLSSLSGASALGCVSGACVATTCQSGYNLVGGSCQKIINTATDTSNCGAIGKVCPSSYANGSGSTCLNGVCQPVSCNAGYQFNYLTSQCVSTSTDVNNCGAIGKVCAFPFGYGKCNNGACQFTSCMSGYALVDGACKSFDFNNDAKNCGSVGNDCTTQYPGGVGTCSSGKCTLSSCQDGYKLVTTTTFSLFGLWQTTTSCQGINLQTDPDNCGSVGYKCPANIANGFNPTCTNGKCLADCQGGFDWDPFMLFCRNVQNDVQNCGKCGQTCSTPNGSSTCVNGVCQIATCNAGYYNVNGQCVQLDTSSDIKNCGSVGFVCPASYPNGSGVSCVSGKCRATVCNNGYTWDAVSSTCKATSNDVNNCGALGKVCAFPNGSGSCQNGQCVTTSCNNGFQLVGGSCVSMDLQTDVNNCGAVGNKCSFWLGTGACQAGKCVYTSCNAPYALQNGQCQLVDLLSDPKNCGKVGNVCPSSYRNGGAGLCILGVCQTTCSGLFDFDFLFGFCRDVSSDVNNCGKCGSVCTLPGASATQCISGACQATACQAGYTLKNGACTQIDTTCDVNNCGSVGHVCTFSPAGASGICQNSKCVLTNCPAGYTLSNGVCTQMNGSQRARAKRDKVTKPKSLCPEHETACPIVGSASFASVSSFTDMSPGALEKLSGGYECLDTSQSLESCGGCASTGEGQDCTKIRGAVGVGCDAGSCVVFSCQAGWRPNLSGTKCVRVRSHNDTTSEGTEASRATGARRHNHAARHGHHHHSS
ncbi:hypothetical protein ACM66B_001613 [Microbotryomycetes sp. NB124-2]